LEAVGAGLETGDLEERSASRTAVSFHDLDLFFFNSFFLEKKRRERCESLLSSSSSSSLSLSLSLSGSRKRRQTIFYHGREREQQARGAGAGEQGVEREARQQAAREPQLREGASSARQALSCDSARKAEHGSASHRALGFAGEHRQERRRRRRGRREQRVLPLQEKVGFVLFLVLRFVLVVPSSARRRGRKAPTATVGSRGGAEGGEAAAAAGGRGESEGFRRQRRRPRRRRRRQRRRLLLFLLLLFQQRSGARRRRDERKEGIHELLGRRKERNTASELSQRASERGKK